jgi:hypothetical protein
VASTLLVEESPHALLLEGLGDEVEGRSRIAVLAGSPDHGHPVDQVRTQHLVLDLDLVLGEEEREVAEKRLGAHGLRVRMEQTGCGEGATTLFLGQL